MPTSLLTPTALNPLLLGKDYTILHLEEGSQGNVKSKCVRDIQKRKENYYNISRQVTILPVVLEALLNFSFLPAAVLSNEYLPDLGGSFDPQTLSLCFTLASLTVSCSEAGGEGSS